ncbi:TetR/AcrR family transcriptional regulator [Actinopolymorpha sp. B11F2]|uniref:TetR/AcrR family transcriptional regulator n=1 Tax=Actinopolymorpha sp. B11F2 TaxID=3160862 RepID=UPI0032E45C7F
MGHREQLLAGAKQCLKQRGYARTTARDIVAASGTNLASIGYHFGSKEALLLAALIEAFGEWDEEFVGFARTTAQRGGSLVEQWETIWTWVVDSFDRLRPLMVAHLEAVAQAQHIPALRQQLADYYERSRSEYVSTAADLDLSDEEGAGQPGAGQAAGVDLATRAVGSFHMALIDGLMVQWLIDPERTPSAQELGQAWRALMAAQSPQGQRSHG